MNAAEKRNAIGGDMCKLIREIAKLKFFKDTLSLSNNRYQHYEIAAKFLFLERTQMSGMGIYADLKKRYLDDMVIKNKSLTAAESTGLSKRVSEQLDKLARVFTKHDKLLSKQAYPPLYYLFVKRITSEYADPFLYKNIHSFLETFQVKRLENLEKSEDERDGNLIEFGRLMQQGTNDINSLIERVALLTRYFLQFYPEVELKDPKRLFTDEERLAIWILGGKKCAICGKEIELDDMHADHQDQWSKGGKTTLSNGRCLCASCNTGIARKLE